MEKNEILTSEAMNYLVNVLKKNNTFQVESFKYSQKKNIFGKTRETTQKLLDTKIKRDHLGVQKLQENKIKLDLLTLKPQLTALQARTYFLNLLNTKTNMFITITTFDGRVLISKSAKMVGYVGPKKRMKEVGSDLADAVIEQFYKRFPEFKNVSLLNFEVKQPLFIVTLRGSKGWKHVKLIRYLAKNLKLYILRIIEKQDYPFNGCRLKIKKRKKRKHKKQKFIAQKWVRAPKATSFLLDAISNNNFFKKIPSPREDTLKKRVIGRKK